MRQLKLEIPYRYDDLLKDVIYLEQTYPDFVKVYKIGESEDGRDILVLQVGTGPVPVIITSGVHGRETINPMVILRVIETYLELAVNKEPIVVDFGIRERLEPARYESQGVLGEPFYEIEGGFPFIKSRGEISRNEVTAEEERFRTEMKQAGIPTEYSPYRYLDTFSFYIVPLVNPDGYEIALGGFDTIRNPALRQRAKQSGIPAAEWKDNARGVDINRNFPSATWQKKFPGDEPGSEKETQALMYLFEQIPAIGYLDLHSRGKAIYYYRSQMSDAYNRRQEEIAHRLMEVTGYERMPPEEEFDTNDSGGNTVHYFSEQYGRPAITIETVLDMDPFPLDVRHQTPAYQELLLVPLEFASAVMESSRYRRQS